MSNLFRSELIMPYRKTVTAGTGEWTTRNGIPCMDIRPAPFYKNLDDGTVSGILRGQFAPLTSYIIDMWIDVDDVISGGNNVAAGFTLRYTDGTTESFVFTGGNKGFQHKKVITPNTKSINLLDIYYYTSIAVYYRWDSYITPVGTLNTNKAGQLYLTNGIENQALASFSNGGSAYSQQFYEY